MIPLFKGKNLDKDQPGNYRGIAVICTLSKLYSKVV